MQPVLIAGLILKAELANYGIDELRFTKLVYAGDEIFVRFTCKEKIKQEIKEPNPEVPFLKM